MADKAAKVLAQLQVALAAGDFYSALQMYRTVAIRRFDAGAVDEFRSLVVSGARALASHGKPSEAADLGDLLIKTLDAKKVSIDSKDVDAVMDVSACLTDGGGVVDQSSRSSSSHTKTATEIKAHAIRVSFLQSALRWAKSSPRSTSSSAGTKTAAAVTIIDNEDGEDGMLETDADPPAGSRQALLSKLELVTARACVAAGDEYFADAQKHFVATIGSGSECGQFLFVWSSAGYPSERELFLTRCVLYYLRVGNLRDANAMRDTFLQLGGEIDSPLARFVKYLLLTAERDAQPLFLTLVDKYRPALVQRDPELMDLVTEVGHRFFNIQPPQNPMQEMMKNMMGLGGGGGGGMPKLPFPGMRSR